MLKHAFAENAVKCVEAPILLNLIKGLYETLSFLGNNTYIQEVAYLETNQSAMQGAKKILSLNRGSATGKIPALVARILT